MKKDWLSSPYIKGTVVHLAPRESGPEEESYSHREGSTSNNSSYADQPPPINDEDDLYSVSTYAVNDNGDIMTPQEAMSRASNFRSSTGEVPPTTTTSASRPRHLNVSGSSSGVPGFASGPSSPMSPAHARPQSEAWQHHPSEALETPPSYDGPPEYEPMFHYDKADKYRYSLAQKDRWQLHDPLRDGDPNWDNLNARDPNVLEESKEVQRYRKAKAKAEARERHERERDESISGEGSSGGNEAEIGFGGVSRQMSAQGQREGMLWGSSVGMGRPRFE